MTTDSITTSPERFRDGSQSELQRLARILGGMSVSELQSRIRGNLGELADEVWENASWRKRISAEYGVRSREGFEGMLLGLQRSLRPTSASEAPRDVDIRRRKGFFERAMDGVTGTLRTLWNNKGKILIGALGIFLLSKYWKAIWDYIQGYLHRNAARPAQREIENAMSRDSALRRALPEVRPLRTTPTPADSDELSAGGNPSGSGS